MERRNETLIKLAQTGLLAALCFVTFTFLQIKIPLPGGDATSFHLGNTFCVLGALILGGWYGGLAGAVGMTIADVLDPVYIIGAPKTFVLKLCIGLITGESIGQVASQTMFSLRTTDEVCQLPVYRPVIGFDKQEIVDLAEKIGTYETSILPYEDCCTIFVAKHPVTKPNVKSIKKSETKLAEKIEEMVDTAVRTEEVIWCS